eukprot:5084322-Amphidinium_carterae.2
MHICQRWCRSSGTCTPPAMKRCNRLEVKDAKICQSDHAHKTNTNTQYMYRLSAPYNASRAHVSHGHLHFLAAETHVERKTR